MASTKSVVAFGAGLFRENIISIPRVSFFKSLNDRHSSAGVSLVALWFEKNVGKAHLKMCLFDTFINVVKTHL